MKESIIKIKQHFKQLKIILYIFFSIILFIILGIILFDNLGNKQIANWDEARHGVNAYEMIQNKNYITTTYGYKTDYWNLKPPISDYLIILGYKIFGYNSFGLRFYSAFAMFICVIICYIYSYKKIGKFASLWTILGFLIINPLIFDHCARSGDADSLYILFSTISIIGLLINTENMKGFYISCLSFALAFLTKSWHAGNIAFIIIIYFFINIKKLKINIKKIIIALLFSTIPILIWGIIRFSNDGLKFFEQMINYDLLKRSSNTIEGHIGGKLFYYDYILKIKSFIIFFALICFIIQSKKENNNKILILFISIIIPFIIFSLAKTKIYWYIYCIFPSIIILSAYGIQSLIEHQSHKKYIIIVGILFMTSIFVYNNIISINESESINYNPIFTLLKRDNEYSGKDTYIFIDDDNNQNWEQKNFLSVELAGNIKPINGGYNSWKNNKKSYLLVNNINLEKIEEQYEIVEKGYYYLIKHK